MSRCLTVTLNASVDVTYTLDRLRVGGVTRVRRKRAIPGGKGNNVARVLRTLGQDVTATGLLGGEPGRFIERELRASGIATAFSWVAGDSRHCLAFMEEESAGAITEVLESGPVITPAEIEALLTALPELAVGIDAAIVCGSLPAGLPVEAFGAVLRTLRASGAFLAVDTSGEPLRLALHAGVDLVAPNLAEMATAGGCPPEPDAVIAHAREAIGAPGGPGAVLLTLGERGAMLIREQDTLHATPPPLTVVNTVGSGDALLAGFIDARLRGASDSDCLAAAVAAGSAAALQEVAGLVALDQVERIRAGVTVQRWAMANAARQSGAVSD